MRVPAERREPLPVVAGARVEPDPDDRPVEPSEERDVRELPDERDSLVEPPDDVRREPDVPLDPLDVVRRDPDVLADPLEDAWRDPDVLADPPDDRDCEPAPVDPGPEDSDPEADLDPDDPDRRPLLDASSGSSW